MSMSIYTARYHTVPLMNALGAPNRPNNADNVIMLLKEIEDLRSKVKSGAMELTPFDLWPGEGQTQLN